MEAATTHPNCLTRPVLTLRESSLCTCALTILVCSLILGLTFGPSFTSEEQLIAGCASLGPMLILALTLYCEYKRQLREEAIPRFPFDEIPDFNEEPTTHYVLNPIWADKSLTKDNLDKYINDIGSKLPIAQARIANPDKSNELFPKLGHAQEFVNLHGPVHAYLVQHRELIIDICKNQNTPQYNRIEYLIWYCLNIVVRNPSKVKDCTKYFRGIVGIHFRPREFHIFFRKKEGDGRVFSLQVKQPELQAGWTHHFTAEGDIGEILCGHTQITQPEGLKAREALFLLTRDRHPTFELVDPPEE